MSVTKVGAALLESGSKGADIASAGTMVIGKDGSYFDITGTTGITAMTVDAGRIFTLQFDGAVVLTHSSTLYLAGAANFTTEANDHLTFLAVAANNVRLIGVGLKDGGSPVAAAGGKILQVLNTQTGAVATGTTTLTHDDSIPQITQGTEFMTLAITPASASNKLIIDIFVNGSHTANNYNTVALFQDSTANALASMTQTQGAGEPHTGPSFRWYMTAGTTSATTMKVRVGNHAAGTYTLNGVGGSRHQGGSHASSLTIWEIEV